MGGEGLQGPVPNRPQRTPERLANKQAELRNKAEGVDLRFQVLNYHRSDLEKMIEQMHGVENDLHAGRYQNALRRREILLEGLGQVKMDVNGEFTIRQDTSANLPTDIQKEILGSMQEASPQGWDRLNRQYFERLGKTPRATLAPKNPSPPTPLPSGERGERRPISSPPRVKGLLSQFFSYFSGRYIMVSEKKLQEYRDEIRKQVCSRCIERPPGGPPCLPLGKQCGIEMHLPQLIDSIHQVRSIWIRPYLEHNRQQICQHCCALNSRECPCPMNYLAVLLVTAVETVDERLQAPANAV